MPSKLPNCQLVEVLRAKAEARTDIEFNYLARLEDFRHRVGGEVRFINQLFPEYTPHDEEYHLSRLFHVADTLIGQERYEMMNATELFVLACGLYGHDWGMAVSDAERRYIISGNLPEGSEPSDFALLSNEKQTFKRFVAEKGISDDDLNEDKVSIEDWREYVRRTHAFRSGERVRHYFRNIDSGVADAGARVCEGHWLDINVLQDYRQFPSNFAVLRENLNLAALAVYVRLVDLLDIGHDRTPYVIWKFVAPRDRRSHMEWNKHRALQPVTCPPYLNGRIILIDGSTNDNEVYAALEDLHNYCESQVRECMDLLAQLGDHRHQLDLYHVEWRVAPRGFDPVPIRFEFARDRVFEILSDEIYQGDPYVFLRELLQNSIDAIRMRREILKRRGGVTLDSGLIQVKVEHGSNGDVTVTWIDDGIGMDAYVVRNYLAVAGRSYYRSEDFEQLGLALDPISRFGIGILSCFMVADRIDIETYKDPYASSASGEPLRIQIPAVTRQFRVEKCSPAEVNIGTRVVVYVEGRRLPPEYVPLDVTEYLKRIAGFVEFPILILEGEYRTLIVHPKSTSIPSEHPVLQSHHNIKVHSISFGYPFEEVFFPQDVESARAQLSESRVDLIEDLALVNYEGCLTYLELREKTAQLERDYTGGIEDSIKIIPNYGGNATTIRWNRQWPGNERYANAGVPPSANPYKGCAVYRDGILVPDATSWMTYEHMYRHYKMPPAQLVVNLSPKDAPELDLARTTLLSKDNRWFDQLVFALQRKLDERLKRELQEVRGYDRLNHFGLFLSSYHLGGDFFRGIDCFELPVAVLTRGGRVEVETWQKWANKPVRICPKQLREAVRYSIFKEGASKGFLSQWVGDDAVIPGVDYTMNIPLEAFLVASEAILAEFYEFTEVVLLESPSAAFPPLAQEVWYPRVARPNQSIKSIAEVALENPLAISQQERDILASRSEITWKDKFVVISNCTLRPFSISGYIYNLAHPVVELIFRSIAWLYLAQERKEEREVRYGRLKDALYAFTGNRIQSPVDKDFERDVLRLLTATSEVGLVPRSSSVLTVKVEEIWYRDDSSIHVKTDKTIRNFGHLLEP